MSKFGFNYNSPSFRQISAYPGFWDYVTDIGRRFRIFRSRRALQRRPDHILKDIGIGRTEIHRTAAHGRARDEAA